ncbi:hypothetical protein HanRHA438_Chr16g0780951 [Helianthus annuus]|nr:hypothetical protein HanRHA438_Chr16g0780951 [Helianthus annuus]
MRVVVGWRRWRVELMEGWRWVGKGVDGCGDEVGEVVELGKVAVGHHWHHHHRHVGCRKGWFVAGHILYFVNLSVMTCGIQLIKFI